MKKLNQLIKIEVHFTTLIYFLLSIILGLFKQTLTIFFIVIIHECSHTLTAYCFNFKINKIKIMPFGAFLELDDFGLHHVLEELCVVMAGPLIHIVLHAFFIYLYRLNLISYIHLNYCLSMNRTILLFNLLPIYPLDGSKLITLVLSYFIDYLKVLKITLYLSSLSFLVLLIHYFEKSYSLILSFLLINIIQYYKEYYLIYHRFLTSRLNDCNYKRRKLHYNKKFHRPYYNYYFFNNSFYDEKNFIVRQLFIDFKKKK